MRTTVSIPLGFNGDDRTMLEDVVIYVEWLSAPQKLAMHVVGALQSDGTTARLAPVVEAFCEHFLLTSDTLKTQVEREWVDAGNYLPNEAA